MCIKCSRKSNEQSLEIAFFPRWCHVTRIKVFHFWFARYKALFHRKITCRHKRLVYYDYQIIANNWFWKKLNRCPLYLLLLANSFISKTIYCLWTHWLSEMVANILIETFYESPKKVIANWTFLLACLEKKIV